MADAALETVRRAAEAFARALAVNDLAGLASCLADECAADLGPRRVTGRDAILAAYAAATGHAERHFDEVRREADVDSVAGAVASIRLREYRLEVPGRWLHVRRRVELTVDASGAVVRIVERDTPGERRALDGLTRQPGSPAA